jgi:aminobenzoyl-glutamate utilization protein B
MARKNTAQGADPDAAKAKTKAGGDPTTQAHDFLERNMAAVSALSDSLFYFGELGMQEHESAALMTSLLEENGFEVERGIAGFPTGFMATWGSGKPVIAVHTEYDANPTNSQVSGVTERKEIVPGAPGHCEGHNCNGTVMIAGAIAAKKAMEAAGIKGTLKLFGAPGEEQLISRPYFVRDGYFKDVDAAFHVHISGEFDTCYGLTHYAAVSAYFTFHGESSHASVTPWKARDALDAVVLMDMGMAQFREHMETDMRAHRVITSGGDQPNVIPSKATVWWTFRGPSAEIARRLYEQGVKIAKGAAMMTNTEVSVEVMSAVWPVRTNQGLAEVIQRNIEAVGVPAWTQDEDAFARELQKAAGAPTKGLTRAIPPLTGPTRQRSPSNDCGDVSWVVPMGRVAFPANVPGIAFHHWGGGAALASSIAHKGTLVGAKALAGSVIDLITSPAALKRANETFAEEVGDVGFRSLLPPDQKPPVDLNREQMEHFRPLMRPHYLKTRPRFV